MPLPSSSEEEILKVIAMERLSMSTTALKMEVDAPSPGDNMPTPQVNKEFIPPLNSLDHSINLQLLQDTGTTFQLKQREEKKVNSSKYHGPFRPVITPHAE